MGIFARIAVTVIVVLLVGRVAFAASDVYAINVILSMTGRGAAVGADESAALRLYETEVDATGGVRGTPVHFDTHDDQSNPQVAVQETNAVLQQHPAARIVGPAEDRSNS
jgi:branched-chain amino acid transport system substrate-binding protein